MLQNLKVTSETPVTTSGHYRWVVCGLLFFATTVNYMDRQILSLIKPILDNQLHWSNEQFGAVNSAFQGAYATGGLIFGWLIDRLGSKIGLRHFDYGLESRGDGTCSRNQRWRIFRC